MATGYHAIEFLLWGQDLNGTNPGAGNRHGQITHCKIAVMDNCDRRRDYLKAATVLLVNDLEEMVGTGRPVGRAYMDLMGKGEQAAWPPSSPVWVVWPMVNWQESVFVWACC